MVPDGSAFTKEEDANQSSLSPGTFEAYMILASSKQGFLTNGKPNDIVKTGQSLCLVAEALVTELRLFWSSVCGKGRLAITGKIRRGCTHLTYRSESQDRAAI